MKLYAIRYAEDFKYGKKGHFFRNAPDADARIEDFPFFYFLAETGGKRYLIDTGFRDEDLAARMGVHLLATDEAALFLGRAPIDTVIITHSHWDHINNLDLYPEANVVMARKTYEIAARNGTDGVKKRLRGRDAGVCESEREAGSAGSMGSITLVDEELLIDGRFLFRVVGGHTEDSSVVFFEEAGVRYVITGDECYQCENVVRNVPIGIVADAGRNERFIASLHGRDIVPLPSHDAVILAKYRRVSENVVQIIGD